jgi:hypothetical protein
MILLHPAELTFGAIAGMSRDQVIAHILEFSRGGFTSVTAASLECHEAETLREFLDKLRRWYQAKGY